MIITFGHTKGGTGKSTLAVNLAIHWAVRRKVLLVDGDEQRSALNFTALRAEHGKNDYTAVALYGTSLRTQGMKLAAAYDDLIIDVGGSKYQQFSRRFDLYRLARDSRTATHV